MRYLTHTLAVVAVFASISGHSPSTERSHISSAPVRIGVYDSRAIAVAWAASAFNPVGEKTKELEAARKAGDEAAVTRLEAWGKTHQMRLHFQGFGRVPVDDLLQPVSEPMKHLLKDLNLAAIAMQCDQVAERVEVVDVTADLVGLFNPTEKTLKWVEQMKGKDPLPLDEIAKLPADK